MADRLIELRRVPSYGDGTSTTLADREAGPQRSLSRGSERPNENFPTSTAAPGPTCRRGGRRGPGRGHLPPPALGSPWGLSPLPQRAPGRGSAGPPGARAPPPPTTLR